MLPVIESPINDVGGLPLHPLIVHAPVVLIPLTAAGVIVMATSGSRSKRYGPLIVAVAVVATITAFLAELSGTELRKELGLRNEQHFEWGEYLPWVMLVLLALVLVLFLLDRQTGGNRNAASTILMFITLAVAVGATVLTILVGHSGAELVWS